jgi:hypothetical protein
MRRYASISPTRSFRSCASTRRAAATSSRAASARWCRSRARSHSIRSCCCWTSLSPAIIPSIGDGIASIRKLGHGILMAESNVHHIPEHAESLYVLERGEIIYQGKPGDTYPPEVMKVIGGSA